MICMAAILSVPASPPPLLTRIFVFLQSSVMLAEKGAARLESTAAGTTTIVVTDYWQLAATMQMCIWDVSNHTMPVKISPMGYQAFHTLR